ncbi:MAG: methionine sulfoxide reductase [Mesoaciditoga sp.]|uniref:bifunctional methionine sulfoxide reductase B/A protein n=2 Tax=Athalassotoga sp. TaxID=2022597 RepID=UPI000CA92B44|nr:MAG: methionine sulfoxide reductase [Mesoaciditoga sp.]PMP80411.1 MAG: methionine sulfoxide reductase [Mesoaciditoga sp.]HEU23565.1 bifunctional methionine sulfoxide reductase B/A protein [Mesoaciditoga lauensis]
MKKEILNELNPYEEFVIIKKGTERPFTGKYNDFYEQGLYVCKRCGLPLYESDSKFKSECGWPSFDEEIPGAVKRQLDADGKRIEITCAYCGAHLGHLFEGEGYTPKNVRHCVNSVSMEFVPEGEKVQRNRAFFAAGCFWGSEYMFKKYKGVLDTRVGYMGGKVKNPSYDRVCTGLTGHYETVEVIYDSTVVSYEELVRFFFEIHDFSQFDGQGPDIGEQYKSVIFYTNEEQRRVAGSVKEFLIQKGRIVATQIKRASDFWLAEEYHQNYYEKTGKAPYCHFRRKVF